MMHFSCDGCGKDLTADGRERYVVRVDAYRAAPAGELTAADLDDDQIEQMAKLLQEHNKTGAALPEPLPESQQLRFDLCVACYRRFVQNPLGRESVPRFRFSKN